MQAGRAVGSWQMQAVEQSAGRLVEQTAAADGKSVLQLPNDDCGAVR
jgi:hypothetical protein